MAAQVAPNAIFCFKHEAPTATPDESLCVALVDAVQATIASITATTGGSGSGAGGQASAEPSAAATDGACARLHLDPLLQDRAAPLGLFSARDRTFLAAASAQLAPPTDVHTATRGTVWTARWFPQYAAALQFECVSADALALRVVALDGWERALHFPAPGECVDSAVPTKHALIHCGRVDAALRGHVLAALDHKLDEAAKRTGSSRSANNKNETPGHQKTPPFLAAMVRNAVDAAVTKQDAGDRHLPRGGMTDVGKHTGGEARDTCWPLVAAALRQALPGNAELFPRFELALFSRFLTDELAAVRKVLATRGTFLPRATAVSEPLDRCVLMLDAIAQRMLALGDRGFDGTSLEEKCRQWRLDIDTLAQSWSDLHKSCFPMPTPQGLRALRDSATATWPVEAPAVVDFSSTSADTADVRKTVLATVFHYEFVNPASCPSASILEDYKDADVSKATYKQLASLRAIETFLYRAATGLPKSAKGSTLTPYGYYLLVDWYKTNMVAVTKLANYDEIARVKLQSKYLLLSYIAFSLSHLRACNDFLIFKEYKIALDWQRLDVCVLDEEAARKALLAVAHYMRSFNSNCSGPAVFDLGDHESTRKFARHIAPTLESLTTSYEEITRTWEEHVDGLWDAIQRRKTEVSQHRREMKEFQESIRHYQALLDDEVERLEALRDEEGEEQPNHYTTWDSSVRYGPPPLHSNLTREYKNKLRSLQIAVAKSAPSSKVWLLCPSLL